MIRKKPESADEYLRRYPRICAHIIAESLGYATPLCAAGILRDTAERTMNYCDWIHACYHGDPRPAVEEAIRNRALHEGESASYRVALDIVKYFIDGGEGLALASWL